MRLRSILPVTVCALVTVIFTTDAMAMYHPGLGQFMQRDPHGTSLVSTTNRIGGSNARANSGGFIDLDPAGPTVQYWDGMNLYQYVRSKPLSEMDPTGLHTLGRSAQSYCFKKCGTNRARGGCYNNCRRNLSDQKEFDLWYANEKKDSGWLNNIPACPDKIKVCATTGEPEDCDNGDWYGLSEASQTFHPGAKWCMRSSDDFGGSGQQCCYDSNGDLVKNGLGAGTPDRRHPNIFWNGLAHYNHDVATFNRAWDLDGGNFGPNLRKYLEVRPPSQGGGSCYD